jgi:hypothetical protein
VDEGDGDTTRPGESRHRMRRTRRAAVLSGAAFAVLVIALVVLAAAPTGGPEASAQPAPTPPGLQAPVQSWFKAREGDVVELNNALVPLVQQQTPAAAAVRQACTRLAQATKSLSARGPVPGQPKVDAAAQAGMAQFAQAAAACLAGDVAGAQRLAREGLAARADAQEALDELLEGERS